MLHKRSSVGSTADALLVTHKNPYGGDKRGIEEKRGLEATERNGCGCFRRPVIAVTLLLVLGSLPLFPRRKHGTRKTTQVPSSNKWELDDQTVGASWPYTLGDLLELPSDWRGSTGMPSHADVTVVLTNSPSLNAQLDMLVSSSVQPREVWVCSFDSEEGPDSGTMVEVVESFKKKGAFEGRLQTITSDLGIGMWGYNDERQGLGGGSLGDVFLEGYARFQLAMQAGTKYIWVLNPEVIPGHRFLELLAHTSSSSVTAGCLGGAGGIMPAAPIRRSGSTLTPFALWSVGSYLASGFAQGREEGEGGKPEAGVSGEKIQDWARDGLEGMEFVPGQDTGTTWLSPVDELYFQWFLEVDHVRLLFREDWLSRAASEGMELANNLRRYAGLQSLVLPQDPALPEFRANIVATTHTSYPQYPRHGLLIGKSEWGLGGDDGKEVSEVNGSYLHARWRQFLELSAIGGGFLKVRWRYPSGAVLLVVQGPEQATFLSPLYRELMAAGLNGAGVRGSAREVFVALVSTDKGSREETSSPSHLTPIAECTGIATALGIVSEAAGSSISGGVALGEVQQLQGRGIKAQQDGEGGGGEGESRAILGWDRVGRAAMDFLHKEESGVSDQSWAYLTPEEFCNGDAFGVFHIRVGQDYPRAAGRPADAFVEVLHSLSGVMRLVSPTVVAYIYVPNGNSHEGVGGNGIVSGQGSGNNGNSVGNSVLEQDGGGTEITLAVEAALRDLQRSGKTRAPLALPNTLAAAGAAKVLAHLPEGGMEGWKTPSVVLVVTHPKGASVSMLSFTLGALNRAWYVGDSVRLQLALHAEAINKREVEKVLGSLTWSNGRRDIIYVPSYGASGSIGPSPDLMALESVPHPNPHEFVVPLTSGTEPSPYFYLSLKFALVTEVYSAEVPTGGMPVSPWDPFSILKTPRHQDQHHPQHDHLLPWSEKSTTSRGGGEGLNSKEAKRWYSKFGEGGGEGEPGAPDNEREDRERRGRGLALSLPRPQGYCQDSTTEDLPACSGMWMYGRDVWQALQKSCQMSATAATDALGWGGGRCRVGDAAVREGVESWGLEKTHLCGSVPMGRAAGKTQGPGGADKWERATVWKLRWL